MSKNDDLKNVTVEELSTLARNNVQNSALVQRIYKYTSNITGSDPFWFQRRRELVAQCDQEGLEGTIFWIFSVADNHWRNLMKLLDVPEDAPIHTRRKAVQKNPHIVGWYFCRRMEKAVTHLIKNALQTAWISIVMNFKHVVLLMVMECHS